MELRSAVVAQHMVGDAQSSRRWPVFGSLKAPNPSPRRDLVAGLTVWAVLIPESLAYATIAGVSPVVGLYAVPLAMLAYAALGSSRLLIVGPASATAALSAAVVADVATDADNAAAYTAALAIIVGVLALAAGLLRLGFVANFISEPVLKGFIIGLALTIIVGQIPKMLGIEKGGENFFEQLWHVLTHLGDTTGRTLVVAAASLAIVLLLRKFAPAVPGSLVAVAFGIAIVEVLDWSDKGVAIVGQVDSGLPSFGFPDGVSNDHLLALTGSAAGVVLVAFAEGLSAAKAFAVRSGDVIDANAELRGVGAANIAAGLSSGMVVNGSLSKTAVNASAGARTQLVGLVIAVLTVVTLLFLTDLFEQLPEATLGAVVVAAVIDLVDVPALRSLHRIYTRRLGRIYGHAARPDFIAAIVTMIGVLAFDTLPGLFLGIVVSLILLLYRVSQPHVAELGALASAEGRYVELDRNPDGRAPDGISVLRVESGLFFVNADAVRHEIEQHASQPDIRAVVLDAETVAAIDVTAVKMLEEVAADLASAGVRFALARGIGQVRDVLDTASESAIAVYPTVRQAVAAMQEESP